MTRAISGALWTSGPVAVMPQGVVVTGTPTVRAWATAFLAVSRAKSGVQWATGDLLMYADTRGYDAEAVEAAMDATGQQRGTLANLKAISRRFPSELRHAALPWSHHALVASLPVEAAEALLVQAETNKWGWEELRTHAREERMSARRGAQAWPEGTYGLLLADPPWERHPERRLAPMTAEVVAALGERVQAIAAPDAVLYMWAPSSKVASGEVATVLAAWGFVGRAAHAWVQERLGPGAWTRSRHEHLIVATRGTPVPPADDRVPDSVIAGVPRTGQHRPDEAYAMLEHCYPGVPRVELFANYAREGWVAWASELGVTEEQPENRAIALREGELAGATA